MRDWLEEQISVTKELLARDDRDAESELFHSGRLEAFEDALELYDAYDEDEEFDA